MLGVSGEEDHPDRFADLEAMMLSAVNRQRTIRNGFGNVRREDIPGLQCGGLHSLADHVSVLDVEIRRFNPDFFQTGDAGNEFSDGCIRNTGQSPDIVSPVILPDHVFGDPERRERTLFRNGEDRGQKIKGRQLPSVRSEIGLRDSRIGHIAGQVLGGKILADKPGGHRNGGIPRIDQNLRGLRKKLAELLSPFQLELDRIDHRDLHHRIAHIDRGAFRTVDLFDKRIERGPDIAGVQNLSRPFDGQFRFLGVDQRRVVKHLGLLELAGADSFSFAELCVAFQIQGFLLQDRFCPGKFGLRDLQIAGRQIGILSCQEIAFFHEIAVLVEHAALDILPLRCDKVESSLAFKGDNRGFGVFNRSGEIFLLQNSFRQFERFRLGRQNDRQKAERGAQCMSHKKFPRFRFFLFPLIH